MYTEEKKFRLYLTVLRFLTFKITPNLRRIFLDFDMNSKRMKLSAFYDGMPSELEEELFDDIVTNSNAHIPDFFIEGQIKTIKELDQNEKHDFIIFAPYEPE